MFLIRRAKVEDVDTLLKLAKMVYFINLPPDKDIITTKVLHSRNCFIKAAGGVPDTVTSQAAEKHATKAKKPAKGIQGWSGNLTGTDAFMFALEDSETGSLLGTSQVIAHVGGLGNPTVAFKLTRREFFSQSLQSGTTHITAKLHLDESSPSEIGGLIIQPSYRRHKAKLGRFLSCVRFHFMGLHRGLFADVVTAEMMAPITAEGQNLFWDCLGRRFIGLSYAEADRFCQYSREFMMALLPREEIYLTLLPAEARAAVAQVGPETVPALKLLESLGFRHEDLIDPFDGGPYLAAKTDDLTLVQHTQWAESADPAPDAKCDRRGMLSVLDKDGEFRAIDGAFMVDSRGRVCPNATQSHLLRAVRGDRIGVTPTDGHALHRVKSKAPRRATKGARA